MANTNPFMSRNAEPPISTNNAFSEATSSTAPSLQNIMTGLHRLRISNDQAPGSNHGIYNNGVNLNSNNIVSYQTLRNYVNMSEVLVKRKLLELALTPNGSMLLQEKLKQNDQMITKTTFEAIFDYLFPVMTHRCGTHVFGKLIECCDQSQLRLIVQKITLQRQTFVESLCTKPGADSAKRLIKVLVNSPLVSEITSILVSYFVPVMIHPSASFVVVKCFEVLSTHQNQKLYEELIKYCLELAKDERGCLALIDSIDLIRGPHRNQLFERISNYAVQLSQDPSGNYVLQRVLKLHDPYLTDLICGNLQGNFVNLSIQKCASHVVENCLINPFGTKYVLQEFVNYDKLWQLARDQYGNYVIQRALKVAKLRKSTFYYTLLTKLEADKQKFQKGYGQNVYNMIIDTSKI